MRLYTARWVCPVAAPPLENGCVAVSDDGEIAWVGRRAGAPHGTEEMLGDVILTPGLVNAHSHLELTGLRGCINENDFFSWVRTLVELKKKHLDDESLRASSCIGIAEGIRAGITTFADTSDSEAPMHAMLRLGVRGIAYREVFGPDPAQCHDAMSALRARVERMRVNEQSTVSVGVSPHAPYTVSDELYREVAAFARAARLPVAVHVAESEAESEYVVRGAGAFAGLLRARGIAVGARAASPVALLSATGILASRPLLIHALRVSDEDIRAIRSSGSSVVHCPVSNAKLGHGFAPVMRFFDEGITTAIGTDSVVSNNRMDLLEEARMAALLQRAHAGRGDLLPAAQLLEMLTLSGARALGLDSIAGSLEVGKRADMTAFSLSGTHALPAHDPNEVLIHSLRGSDASFVMVDGKVLMRGGELEADLSWEEGVVRRLEGTLRKPE